MVGSGPQFSTRANTFESTARKDWREKRSLIDEPAVPRLASMKCYTFLLIAALLFPVYSMAAPTAAPVKIREWSENASGQIDSIVNHDKYVDYMRDGKVVFRMIERTVTVKFSNSSQTVKAATDILEFVLNGNVIASVDFNKDAKGTCEMASGAPIYFSSGSTLDGSFFYICVPQENYFEYVETKGTELTFLPDSTYEAMKATWIKKSQKGFINPLGHEETLIKEAAGPK